MNPLDVLGLVPKKIEQVPWQELSEAIPRGITDIPNVTVFEALSHPQCTTALFLRGKVLTDGWVVGIHVGDKCASRSVHRCGSN